MRSTDNVLNVERGIVSSPDKLVHSMFAVLVAPAAVKPALTVTSNEIVLDWPNASVFQSAVIVPAASDSVLGATPASCVSVPPT